MFLSCVIRILADGFILFYFEDAKAIGLGFVRPQLGIFDFFIFPLHFIVFVPHFVK